MARGFQNLRGFTLIELAIVITIIAVVTASGMMMGNSMLESARRVSTNNKLNTIEAALMAYRMAYNRIPCPTDATLTESSSNFGKEAANAGSCTGGAPAANYIYAPNNVLGTVAEGAVPVRSLSLPDEYQVDGWGRKISYAVWTPLTDVSGFITHGITPSCGAITVNNAGGGRRSTAAGYALISYGPDGHGAYLKSGTRYSAGSTNTDEQTNAHYNAAGVDTGYLATYVQKEWTQNPTDNLNVFDDIVRYKERWQLQNAYDGFSPYGMQCIQGFWTYYNGQGGDGMAVTTGDINGDGIPDLIIAQPAGNGGRGAVYVVFGSRSGFTNPVQLNTLNGTNGFAINGVVNNGIVWSSLQSIAVADINGDGYGDLIIGEPGATAGGNANAGIVYVVFGQPISFWSQHAAYTLDNTANTGLIDGTHGFELDGAAAGYYAGSSLAAGDIDGDGKADILIGASQPNYGGGSGAVYVVYGGTGPKSGGSWSATPYTLDLNLLNGINGFTLEAGYMGSSVAAGDINGDGKADIVASWDLVGGVVVLFGRSPPQLPVTTVSTTNGSTAATVGSYSGLVIGAVVKSANIPAGTVITHCNEVDWQHMNCRSANITLSANATATASGTPLSVIAMPLEFMAVDSPLNGANGFQVIGNWSNAYEAGLGTSSSLAVGDIDGDGKADIILGAYAAPNNTGAGAVLVVFGGTGPKSGGGWSGTLYTLDNTPGTGLIDGTSGFELYGAGGGYEAGWSVAAGDVNGDGNADIIVSAPGAAVGGNSADGAVYVVFGGATKKDSTTWASGNPYTLNSTLLNGTNGFELDDGLGAWAYSGRFAAAGDITGDGKAEVITETPEGEAFVYYGRKSGWPATFTAPWP